MDKHIDNMNDIDPALYEFMGSAYYYTEEIDGPMGTERVTFCDLENVSNGRFTNAEIEGANHRGRCERCNHAIRHHVALLEIHTGELIAVGFDCYGSTFIHDTRASLDMAVRKRKLELEAQKEAARRRLEMFKASREQFVYHLGQLKERAYGNFLQDLWDKLHRYGDLTDRQVEAAERVFAAICEAEAYEAMRLPLGVAQSGRVNVKGTVVGLWEQADRFSPYGGSISKMWVEVEENGARWSFSVTVPSSLYTGNRPQGPKRGDVVMMTVTLEKDPDEEHKAWGKRPSKTHYA